MPHRILIVDDDKELCNEVAAILEDEGYSVDIANDSTQGAACINNNRYAVILLDFKMPGLNGVELLRSVQHQTKHSKVILVSGRPHLDKFAAESGISNAIAAVFSKPFDVESLLSTIKKSVEGPAP